MRAGACESPQIRQHTLIEPGLHFYRKNSQCGHTVWGKKHQKNHPNSCKPQEKHQRITKDLEICSLPQAQRVDRPLRRHPPRVRACHRPQNPTETFRALDFRGLTQQFLSRKTNMLGKENRLEVLLKKKETSPWNLMWLFFDGFMGSYSKTQPQKAARLEDLKIKPHRILTSSSNIT